eukprot:8160375-Karenia_brevis.AAC.1
MVDGKEQYQCQECLITDECDGKPVSNTKLRKVVGSSKNFAYYADKNAEHLRDNGRNGAHGML